MENTIDIEDLLSRWDSAWLVDGRPVTNVEMSMLSEWKKENDRRKAQEFLRDEL